MDGSEDKSEFMNSPRLTTARRSAEGDTVFVASTVTVDRGGQKIEMATRETWNLQDRGRVVSILQSSMSFRGERTITMVFVKQ